ncbi:MAG: cupredoxin domain-containing protein [Xanthobacteraceae bacterium]
MRGFVLAIMLAALAAPSAAALAQELNLVIRNHRFEPSELRVPAGKRVSIYVTNEDATPEEFESSALKVEKVIPGKSKSLVRIGPLEPGRYEFIGEFHADTAKGVVIAE